MEKRNTEEVVSGKEKVGKLRMLAMTGVLSSAMLVGGFSGDARQASADTGAEEKVEKETKEVDGHFKEKGTPEFVSPSYNPTEPEIQLGDVSLVDVEESGAVTLDTQKAQGQLDSVGEVAIDGVKGVGLLYYILEKDGDIISTHVKDKKITGDDGSTVKINDVDEIHGRNGTADKDGFKSNLVPEDTLPKTGDAPVSAKTYGMMATFLGLMGIGFGVQKRRKVKQN